MKRLFEVRYGLNMLKFTPYLAKMGLPVKYRKEIADALELMTVWEAEYFRPRFGELMSIEHFSDGDDPPDVVAHFDRGELKIEHTSIDPPHLFQARDIVMKDRFNGCTAIPPISWPALGKKALQKEIYSGLGEGWESVASACTARKKLILDAVGKKTARMPDGAMVLMGWEGVTTSDLEDRAFEEAMDQIRSTLGWERWGYATFAGITPHGYVSTLLSEGFAFQLKRS